MFVVASLKQLPHRFAGGAASDAATDAFGHLFRAAAGNGLNITEQAGQFVEEAAGFGNRHCPFLLSLNRFFEVFVCWFSFRLSEKQYMRAANDMAMLIINNI